MRNITYQQLVQANACADQRAMFKKRYGDAVVPTEELAMRDGHLFDATFAARNFLSAPLLEQYLKAFDLAWEQYEKARASLWEQYEKARDLACERHWKAHTPLWEQYQKARVSLWEQYRRDCMLEFVKLYQQGQ